MTSFRSNFQKCVLLLNDSDHPFTTKFKVWGWALYVLSGPAPQGGDPQHAGALALDLLVAGATALVPAPTPPDR